MGKLSKGWALVLEVLGPYLTERLRNGKPIDIAAENGQIYRIDPESQRLINLTTHEKYCVHPVDGDHYCFPDMVVLWWDYLHLKIDDLEKAVGGPHDGHRSPYFPDGKYVIRSYSANGRMSERPNFPELMSNPFTAFEMLPPLIVEKFDVLMSSFIKFHSEGGISGGIEIQEVVENDEEIEEIEAGEVAGIGEEPFG